MSCSASIYRFLAHDTQVFRRISQLQAQHTKARFSGSVLLEQPRALLVGQELVQLRKLWHQACQAQLPMLGRGVYGLGQSEMAGHSIPRYSWFLQHPEQDTQTKLDVREYILDANRRNPVWLLSTLPTAPATQIARDLESSTIVAKRRFIQQCKTATSANMHCFTSDETDRTSASSALTHQAKRPKNISQNEPHAFKQAQIAFQSLLLSTSVQVNTHTWAC